MIILVLQIKETDTGKLNNIAPFTQLVSHISRFVLLAGELPGLPYEATLSNQHSQASSPLL